MSNSFLCPLRILLSCHILCFLVFTSAFTQKLSAAHAGRELSALTAQWIRIEAQRTALQGQWRSRQVLLKQQLQLLAEEERSVKALLSDTREQRSDVAEKRQDIAEQQTALESHQRQLEKALEPALDELRALHPLLPPPLQDAWTKLLIFSPETQSKTANSIETVLGLLRLLRDFDDRITLHNTSMPLEDGMQHQVQQIFLGTSHAWYVDRQGENFGYGLAHDIGWKWTRSQSTTNLSPQTLLTIIAMLESNGTPSISSLPIQLNLPDKNDATQPTGKQL